MKPGDNKPNTYVKFVVYSNIKRTKFKIGNHVRISKFKNVFSKN